MTKNIDHAADVSVLATRAFSKALFGGAQYRVEIGAAIGQAPLVNTAELSEALGLARQSVNQELRILEGIGLLIRTERSGDSGRKVYLMKQNSDYWAFCAEAALKAADRLKGAQPF
jgi:DNA-binding transcriptional ArsR family regulator